MASKEQADKKKIHIKTYEDCRRLLSSTINQYRRNEINTSEAKTIGYLCGVMLQVLENKRTQKLLDEQDLCE